MGAEETIGPRAGIPPAAGDRDDPGRPPGPGFDAAEAEADAARKRREAVMVALMLAIVTVLHTFTNATTPTQAVLHDLFRRLYYVPILYAAFAFGLRGGLITATAAVLLFFPHAQATLGGIFGSHLDNLFEMAMYYGMGAIFGWLRDVDLRRTSELATVSRELEGAYRILEQRAMRLMAIQDYTQAILRSVTAGVITVAPDGSVATVNHAAELLLRTPEHEMVARSFRALFQEDGGLAADVERVLDGHSNRSVRDVRLESTSGRDLHARAAVSPMLGADGRGLGAVVTIEDISEVRSLAAQLVRAERLAAMGELTAGLAHEVRNPLGVIRASVQLMEDAHCDKERLGHAIGVVKHEIDRLDRVIKALLDFGRPAPVSLRPVSIRTVLADVILIMRGFAGRGGVEIVEEPGERLPEVMADPEQLKQVFVNLIANATQALAGVGGRVTISTGEEGGFVYARFADDGPGIPPEAIDKVFDPFFTTKDDGTGLGLTIVHRIVDEHAGHIEVSSRPGQGTVFTVHLPALMTEGR